MDFILCALALMLLLAAGIGISLIIAPRDDSMSLTELLSLAVLFGAAFISLTSFFFGFVLSGRGLRWAIAAMCIILALVGIRARRPVVALHGLRRRSRITWLMLGLLTSEIGIVAALAYQRVLGWDGLLNWEIKARLAFLNGGVIPLSYFSDPSRTWSLQPYPLLLPLTEAWLYGWLGRPDQEWVKVVPLVFYIAALGLLCAGSLRRGSQGWWRFLPALLLITVPIVSIGDGSASSGYADFPLSVFYLGAIIFLMDYDATGRRAALFVSGCLGGILCWVKPEGAILWLCLMVLSGIKALQRRDRLVLLLTLAPGVILLSMWQTFVHVVEPPIGDNFLPVNPLTLWSQVGRTPVIAQAVLSHLIDWKNWGVLWPTSFLAGLWVVTRPHRNHLLALPVLVFLPICLYSSIFFFSAWPSFVTHLDSSFPRLLLHVSPAAVLMIGCGISRSLTSSRQSNSGMASGKPLTRNS